MFSASLELLTFTLALPALLDPAVALTQHGMSGFTGEKKAPDPNVLATRVVAYVISTANGCPRCQELAPEYRTAAEALHPFVKFDTVDCSDNSNLCANEKIKQYPTIKLYRGSSESIDYGSGPLTSQKLFMWASNHVPNIVTTLTSVDALKPWVEKTKNKHRALFLTKGVNKVALVLWWKVLASWYNHGNQLELAIHRVLDEEAYKVLGVERSTRGPGLILVYHAEETIPVKYDGGTSLKALFEHFASVVQLHSLTAGRGTRRPTIG